MKNFKKVFYLMVSTVLLMTFAFTAFGCGGGEEEKVPSLSEADQSLATAGEEAFTNVNGNQGLATVGWRVEFVDGEKGFRVEVLEGASEKASFYALPVTLFVKGPAATLLGGYTEETFEAGYERVSRTRYGYFGYCEIRTGNGSVFAVGDKYYLEEDEIAVKRQVAVLHAEDRDKGFATAFRFHSDQSGEFDYFVPSILYRDTQYMPSHAIFSNTDTKSMYVLESRTGLPMAMLRSRVSGKSLALVHLNPRLSSNAKGLGVNGQVDNGLQYGALGFENEGRRTVGFRYPCAEGPATYNNTQGWHRVYHDVDPETRTEYSVALLTSGEESYAKSMMDVYERAFLLESPVIAEDVEVEDIWDYNMEMFSETYKEFGSGSQMSAGVPWSMDLRDKEKNTPYSFQMGFVGQQTSVGASMLRTGFDRQDAEMRRKGAAILDFWTSSRVFQGQLPYIWWNPDGSGGQPADYSSFLRGVVDGCEGILDGYIIAKRNGLDKPAWKDAVVKTARFFVENQNSDGSFYRAYLPNGQVNTDMTDPCIQGKSKTNTPIAVRFLYKVYELTGEEAYLKAANKAVEYCYENLYHGLEKYVGGTIDQHNVVDREAAIFALYAFESAFTVTGEQKYLEAAEHAAISALSWVYTYDFKVWTDSANQGYNPFEEGGVIGFSIIATGHSGADNFASYLYYSFFRMYLHTGNEFYLYAAQLLEKNTKCSSDYTGKLRYAYRAIATEATLVASFNYYSVNAWLPWSSVANIDPIGKMRDTFGVASIDDVQGDTAQQYRQLKDFGVGGKLR